MKSKKKRNNVPKFISFITVLGVATALTTDLIGFSHFFVSNEDMTGEWFMTFTTNESSYNPYIGMSLGYKMHIVQDGHKVTGKGETWTVNNTSLPYDRHRPLEFQGRIREDTLYGQYTLEGGRRTTTGSFKVHVLKGLFQGAFSGTAADSKGEVIGQKVD